MKKIKEGGRASELRRRLPPSAEEGWAPLSCLIFQPDRPVLVLSIPEG